MKYHSHFSKCDRGLRLSLARLFCESKENELTVSAEKRQAFFSFFTDDSNIYLSGNDDQRMNTETKLKTGLRKTKYHLT